MTKSTLKFVYEIRNRYNGCDMICLLLSDIFIKKEKYSKLKLEFALKWKKEKKICPPKYIWIQNLFSVTGGFW